METEIGTAISEGFASLSAPAPAPDTSAAPVAPAPAPAAPAPVADPAPGAPAPVASAPATAAADAGKTPESIPLPLYLDTRDENKKLKARLAELEAKAPATPAAPIPSFKDDPEGFAAHMADATNRVAVSTRFDTSEMYARDKHGDDTVTAAMEWGLQRAQQSPAFAAEYLQQRNPIDWAVKQMKRAKIADEIGDDEEAYFTAQAEKRGFVRAGTVAAPAAPATPQPQAAAPAPQPAPLAAPSRSLASAPSAGGPQIVPATGFAALDAINPGR
jgi:hypothetical protein